MKKEGQWKGKCLERGREWGKEGKVRREGMSEEG